MLRSGARRILLNCSRQSGKSTVTSLAALHEALYTPDSLVLILSPSLRQSGELFAKIKAALRSLGTLPVPIARETADTLEFASGARIVSLPSSESTIRGFSGVTLLIVDEASRVPDELYQATRPMLAVTGGRVILLSTPWGKRGFYYEVWRDGHGWHRVKVTAEDCPRISPEWLDAERQSVPSFVFRQEYGCEFVDSEDSYFSSESIEAALAPAVPDLFGGRNPYERIPA